VRIDVQGWVRKNQPQDPGTKRRNPGHPADGDIQKAFKSYPPTAKAIEDKKAERDKIDAAKKSTQP